MTTWTLPVSRRGFLELGAAMAVQRNFAPLELHPDYQPAVDGLEYFFLGNGLLLAAVQSVDRAEAGTQAGLVLMPSERFGRKHSSLLYSIRGGLRHTRTGVVAGDATGYPEAGTSKIRWEYPDGIPTVLIEWRVGGVAVAERIYCAADAPALIRNLTLRNQGAECVVRVITALQPNSSALDEYDVDRARGVLTASGDHRVQVFARGGTVKASDRALSIEAGRMESGAIFLSEIVTTLDGPAPFFVTRRDRTAAYWNSRATLRTGNAGLDHLFRAAQSGVRAAVAKSGKMDGGIWQYNLEWVRDPVNVAQGAVEAGCDDVSRAILERIWTRSVSDDGNTVEASRTRPPAEMELDQNGQLLYATWLHWAWTGDFSMVRKYWPKVRAAADYVLQPVYREPSSGLLKNTREYWERGASHGFREGFELAYQVANIVGLEKAGELARAMNDDASATRWRDASRQMRQSLLSHPQFAMVDDGRFIKRRLVDGTVQSTVEPPNRKSFPAAAPLHFERVCRCDPDATIVFPIIYGLVDGRGELARRTLEHADTLWNQRWSGGGYGRYDITSEPDSLGPWPFASMFLARAWHEAGDSAKVWRVLEWMLKVQGGRAGAWFEVYGPRPLEGFAVGIIPWTWGEILQYFVHHFVGIRPAMDALVVRPRPLDGIDKFDAAVNVNGARVSLAWRRGEPSAKVNGRSVPFNGGVLRLERPRVETRIEIFSGVSD